MGDDETFAFPVLVNEDQNVAFQSHVTDLSELLANTINNDVIKRLGDPTAVKPTAHSIGAALYCTLRAAQLQYPKGDPRRDGVREGFMSVFMLNDDEWKLVELAEHFRDDAKVGSA